MATGSKPLLDFFETQMQCLRFFHPYKKDGKEMVTPIYGMLEPMNLYRYVFPKNGLDSVIKTLKFDKDRYPMFDKQAFMMRKILNADKIPITDPKAEAFHVNFNNIALKCIGIKEDVDITLPDGKTTEAI